MNFRFARHTNNLDHLKTFYINVLGFELLGDFENHNGYNGIFIGKSDENWHLEFTQSTEIVSFNYNDDDILVFYPNTKLEFDLIHDNILANKIKFLESKNPYWNDNGKMFLDPDGFRIIISNIKLQ